jgi:Spy/CpxP family protein refolding chaperone
MNRSAQVLLVALVVSLLAAAPVAAQGGDRPGGGSEGWREAGMLFMLLRGANLTADQQARVREILAAHRGKSEQLVKQLRAAQEELLDRLLAPGTVQAEDLKPARQRIAQVWEQLAQDRLATALEIRGLLTPEQLARAAQVKDRYRALRAEMRALFEGKPGR